MLRQTKEQPKAFMKEQLDRDKNFELVNFGNPQRKLWIFFKEQFPAFASIFFAFVASVKKGYRLNRG